jgi:PST family polysaccharide transporter
MSASASMTAPANAAPPSLLRRLAVNLGWLAAQKIFVILLGVAATGLVARHLGPEQTGLLAGAQALAVLFGIASMGVDATVFTRHLRSQPEKEGAILGGTACVLAVTGVASWLLLASYLRWVDNGPAVLRISAAVIGLRMCLMFPAPVAMWFQARMDTREVALANTTGTLVYRLWQVLSSLAGWSVIRIAWADVLSFSTISLVSLRAYLAKGGSLRTWRADWHSGWQVLAESLPALVATCLVTFMSRIDVIMLRAIRGESDVGFFTAASSITESLLFLSSMMVTVFSPVLVRSFHEDPETYARQCAANTRLTVCLGWCLALGISLFSAGIIAIVFGAAYQPAAAVLALHAFLLVPAMLGAVTQCQLTIERRLRWLMLILVVALAVDVVLNAWLIPSMGAQGAAVASVLAAVFAYTMVPLLVPATRRIGLVSLRSLLVPLPRRGDLSAFGGEARP